MAPTNLVLASSSPRRRELVGLLGIPFDVQAADLDETQHPGEAPAAYVERLAREKARAVAKRRPGARVLAADTTVVLDGQVLGKPVDATEARGMLTALSGRSHLVLTGIAVVDDSGERAKVVETTVHFRPLGEQEIAWYVRGGEPMDKAGAYGLQGFAGTFVTAIEGSSSNVIGLPMAQTLALLIEAGWAPPWKAAG